MITTLADFFLLLLQDLGKYPSSGNASSKVNNQ
jgi:hypothetical protein